jgi:hypothetical protein
MIRSEASGTLPLEARLRALFETVIWSVATAVAVFVNRHSHIFVTRHGLCDTILGFSSTPWDGFSGVVRSKNY